MLKESPGSRNVDWDIVVAKSFGGNFATYSDGNYRCTKFSHMDANMEMRLESKILCNSRNKPFCLPNFPATYNSLLLVNFGHIFVQLVVS